MTYGFVTKADAAFFEGLAALLESLATWHPGIEIMVVDCGLLPTQAEAIQRFPHVTITSSTMGRFRIPESMSTYYSPAVYGFFDAPMPWDVVIHIDADAVLLAPVEVLASTVERASPGICAVPDYPNLTLSYQIGSLEGAERSVREVIPSIDTKSVSFNAGVFAVRTQYYRERMESFVERLLPLHDQLWGNDMAVLNLAAFAASPFLPFIRMPYALNARECYRRAPHLPPNRISRESPLGPTLIGPFGEVKILHFVGKSKPWSHTDTESDSKRAWRFYRERSRQRMGL